MIWILLIVIAGLAVGLGYVLRTRQRTVSPLPAVSHEHAAGVRPAPRDRGFWGRQFIVPDPEPACPQARALHGHCFAYGKTPALPLQGCSSAGCACHYRDLAERRSGKERRSGQDRREQVRFEEIEERRLGKDRRGNHYDWRFTA
ncbi:MAG: hypothetical protein PHX10_11380 [Gallionellaceae bacterium]|nr:hypothetical protein [Gallionellaceae bacterium]